MLIQTCRGAMPRGGARPGAGRKPGTKRNTYTVDFRNFLKDYCAQKKVDPYTFFIDVLAMPDASLNHKLIAAREIAQYIEPKLRSLEHTGQMTMLHKLQHLDTCTDEELEAIIAYAEGLANAGH